MNKKPFIHDGQEVFGDISDIEKYSSQETWKQIQKMLRDIETREFLAKQEQPVVVASPKSHWKTIKFVAL